MLSLHCYANIYVDTHVRTCRKLAVVVNGWVTVHRGVVVDPDSCSIITIPLAPYTFQTLQFLISS